MGGYGFWVARVPKRDVEPDTCLEEDVEKQTCNQEWEGFVEKPSDIVLKGVSTMRQLVTRWLLFMCSAY